MLDAVTLLFSQGFLIRALVVGVLISLCSALLGVSLVLKRFSMIGDGLSHVGFGAMAIACAAGVAPLYFSLPIVLVAAFLLLRMNEKGKIKGDAAIALISTGALAAGIMVTSMTTGMNVDIYNYMFGSILTMSNDDVVLSAIISVVVSALFVIFYNEIFAVTFDENFARATGTKTSLYNMLIAGLTAVTIVIGMRMMGALLISSLIIFPAVTSMRVCKSFRSVVLSSAVISVLCFVLGLIFSVEYEAPTGASVVCVNIVFLFFFALIGKARATLKNTHLKRAVVALLAALLFTAVAVIPSLTTLSLDKKEKISVVAVGFAEYDFARQIAGDKGEVSMLLSAGQESHTYEPTPADIIKIEQCDVFVCGGGESEAWVERITDSTSSQFTVVKMMEVCSLVESDHEHSHTDEHDHGEYDEHVWTSPVNAKLIIGAVSDALCENDGANADYYRANTEKYLAEIDKLDSAFRELGRNAEGKYAVIGDRFPLRYLMLEYNIEYHAAYSGCSAAVEVNPVTIAKLNDMIEKDGISTVFKVDLSNGNVARSMCEQTGARLDTLYSCHVVSQELLDSGETYASLMYKNLEALSLALK